LIADEKKDDSALNDHKHSLTYLLLFTFFINASWFITVLTSTSYITISKYVYYKLQSECHESYLLYFMLFTGWTCENFTELPWKQRYFSAEYSFTFVDSVLPLKRANIPAW
jgi:hypothetical protein